MTIAEAYMYASALAYSGICSWYVILKNDDSRRQVHATKHSKSAWYMHTDLNGSNELLGVCR